jgi:hypothetical protein
MARLRAVAERLPENRQRILLLLLQLVAPAVVVYNLVVPLPFWVFLLLDNDGKVTEFPLGPV